MTSCLFYSKCNSQWENCIGPDEKYLRKQADYFEKYFGDTCPSYNPDDKSDSYPGQPFIEDTEKSKPKNYHQNTYIYNPPNPYVPSGNRRKDDTGETLRLTKTALELGINCRKHKNVAVCGKNYEMKGVPKEEISETKVGPIGCNIVEDKCGDCTTFDECTVRLY